MNAQFDHAPREKNNRKRPEENVGLSMPSTVLVRAQLEMTSPRDSYEQEADEMADSIVNGGKIARSVSSGYLGSGIALPAQFGSRIASVQGQGSRLYGDLKNQMESGFGRDFSNVRLHTDNVASEMSDSISAKAFTYGNDIFFNRGQFEPRTAEGQHLVAHELSHVVQAGGKVAREAVCRNEFVSYVNFNDCNKDSICEKNHHNYTAAKNALETILNNMQLAYDRIQDDHIYSFDDRSYLIDLVGNLLSGIPCYGFLFGSAATTAKNMLLSEDAKHNRLSKGRFIPEIQSYYNNAILTLQNQSDQDDLYQMYQDLHEEEQRVLLDDDYHYNKMVKALSLYEDYIRPIGDVMVYHKEMIGKTVLAFNEEDSYFLVEQIYNYGLLTKSKFIKRLPNDPNLIKSTLNTRPKPLVLYRKSPSNKYSDSIIGIKELNDLLLRSNTNETADYLINEESLLTSDQVKALSDIFENPRNERRVCLPNPYRRDWRANDCHTEVEYGHQMTRNFDEWCTQQGLSSAQKAYLSSILINLDALPGFFCNTFGFWC